jgi:hypothetical protein
VGSNVRTIRPGNGATQRRRLIAFGVVVWPLISGLFFGLIAALLVLRNGDPDRALEIGVLVGGAMFAANAVVLCVLHSASRGVTTPKSTSRAKDRDRTEAHAS